MEALAVTMTGQRWRCPLKPQACTGGEGRTRVLTMGAHTEASGLFVPRRRGLLHLHPTMCTRTQRDGDASARTGCRISAAVEARPWLSRSGRCRRLHASGPSRPCFWPCEPPLAPRRSMPNKEHSLAGIRTSRDPPLFWWGGFGRGMPGQSVTAFVLPVIRQRRWPRPSPKASLIVRYMYGAVTRRASFWRPDPVAPPGTASGESWKGAWMMGSLTVLGCRQTPRVRIVREQPGTWAGARVR